MQGLLDKMNEYWASHEATVSDEHHMFFRQDDEDADILETMFYSKLFKNGGHWNFETKNFLESNGYHCWIGDGDSFGILVACVTKDGKTFSIG